MCGVVGIIQNKCAVSEQILMKMRNTLSHRGPDDEGIWVSKGKRIRFGHGRLLIIELPSYRILIHE